MKNLLILSLLLFWPSVAGEYPRHDFPELLTDQDLFRLDPAAVQVYRNGILQRAGADYDAYVKFRKPCAPGDLVTLIYGK